MPGQLSADATTNAYPALGKRKVLIVSLKLLYSSQGPVARGSYRIWLVTFWVYAALWLTALLFLNLVWSGSFIWKIMISLFAVIVAPSLADLFRPYDGYLEEYDRIMTNRRSTSVK